MNIYAVQYKKMEIIKELTFIVTQNKLDKINLLGDAMGDSKVNQFYHAILAGELPNDEVASKILLPDAKNTSSYRKLKAHYRKLLINTTFFLDLDQPSYNQRQVAYYECYREWAAIKILLGKNARKSAIQLANKVLRYAEKYEFTSLCVDITSLLRLHYGVREGDRKKFDELNERYHYYKNVNDAEQKAEEFYAELMLNVTIFKGEKMEIAQMAHTAYYTLAPMIKKYHSYGLLLYGSLIQYMIYSGENNYKATLTVCDQVIHDFKKKKYTAAVPLQIAYYQKVICQIQLKQFDGGEEAAAKCLKLIEFGSFNWFKYNELYFILLAHTGKYQELLSVYFNSTSNRRFKYLDDSTKEVWVLYKAYLHYLSELGEIDASAYAKKFTTFKLNKFLNEIPEFSKDKAGMNIAVLVLHILFLILLNKYDQVIDRIEAIEKYISRHINKGDTIRSKYFIKMLLVIPNANFHKAAVIRKAQTYREKLLNKPLDLAHQQYKLEIIPYEVLWEFALNSLNNKFHNRG